jgi:hypothetical protein
VVACVPRPDRCAHDAEASHREVIDAELRLLAAVRWSIREHGGEPSSRHPDELLDGWNDARPMAPIR